MDKEINRIAEIEREKDDFVQYVIVDGPQEKKVSRKIMFEVLLSGYLLQTCMVGIVIGLVMYWYLRHRKYNMPPGPVSLPLLGNWFQLGSDTRYHKQFYEWSKKYGPVITVGLGGRKMVVVNDLETAMEVLVKKSTDFAGRYTPPSVDYFTYGSKDIKFSQFGPTWKLHRRISSKALRHYMQGNALEERIHTALHTVMPILDQQTVAFHPDDIINFLVANIITGLCFHGKFEYGSKELLHVIEKDDEFLENFNSEFIPEDVFPPLRYIYQSKGMRRIVHLNKEIVDDFLAKRFYEEKKTFNKDNIRHFVDTLLLAREEADQEEACKIDSLTDDHLIQTLADIFFAGLDTSRYTLRFAILHMIAFPEIQHKVQEEIDREIGINRLPGVTDRPNLGYTEAVLHESMRLATVVPSGVTHRAMCDTEIAGYRLPKDTLVLINHWALHHNPDAWDDVDRFIPERFLDENGRLGPKPNHWLPFSAGKRVCLGEFVAKPQLHLLLSGLMQQFTWKAEEGVHVDTTPQGTAFIASPAKYKVVVSRRNAPR